MKKFPEEFVHRIENQFGTESKVFLGSLQSEASLSLRINPSKWKKPIHLEQVPWSNSGFYLQNRPLFTLDPLFHAGSYYVQEPGSMLLEQAIKNLPDKENRIVLDLCAAPGGKSTHLLSILNTGDLLVANEVIRSRAYILLENIQKWGYSNVIVTNNDPTDFAHLKDLFDVVVVDAPCSGEGLFRKDMAAIDEWSVINAQHCTLRQKRIISEAWECLKPGGYLIYSTCTFNPDENERNLNWISDKKRALPIALNLDESWNIEIIKYGNIVGYQTFTHKTKAEGFFIGMLQKTEEATKNDKYQRFNPLKWKPVGVKNSEHFLNWMLLACPDDFLSDEYVICFLQRKWHPYLYALEKHLVILQAGTPVAIRKGSDFIPHQALSLANRLNIENFSCQELSLYESISFLQRNNISIGNSQNGWILARYDGMGLGWLKNIGSRANNYFPKEWRIRMTVNDIPLPWHEV